MNNEWVTITDPTIVGGVPKLAPIPAIETRSKLMLNDIRIWAVATTIIGNQEAFRSRVLFLTREFPAGI